MTQTLETQLFIGPLTAMSDDKLGELYRQLKDERAAVQSVTRPRSDGHGVTRWPSEQESKEAQQRAEAFNRDIGRVNTELSRRRATAKATAAREAFEKLPATIEATKCDYRAAREAGQAASKRLDYQLLERRNVDEQIANLEKRLAREIEKDKEHVRRKVEAMLANPDSEPFTAPPESWVEPIRAAIAEMRHRGAQIDHQIEAERAVVQSAQRDFVKAVAHAEGLRLLDLRDQVQLAVTRFVAARDQWAALLDRGQSDGEVGNALWPLLRVLYTPSGDRREYGLAFVMAPGTEADLAETFAELLKGYTE